MKHELKKDDCVLVSVSTTYYNLEDKIQTMEVMPESDFVLTVVAARIPENQFKKLGIDPGNDAFRLIATGKWLVNPTYEFTDCMGISWSDEFTLKSTSGYAYTYYYPPANGPLYNYDALTLNKVDNEKGFAYDVDLLLGERQDEISIGGIVYKADSAGSANVSATYGHVILSPSSISVGFSSSGISMSVGIFSGIKMASPTFTDFKY